MTIAAFMIGTIIGALFASVVYELGDINPRWVERVDADEFTEHHNTWVHCRRCGKEASFTTGTVDGGVLHRMAFVRRHMLCAENHEDRGTVR